MFLLISEKRSGRGRRKRSRKFVFFICNKCCRITKIFHTCLIRINFSSPYDLVSKLAPEYPSPRRTFPRALFYLSARAL